MPDIIALLEQDHRNVEQLFAQYDQAQGDRSAIVAEIVQSLDSHTSIEESVLYPAVRARMANGEERANHSEQEHNEVRTLLDTLEADPADDTTFQTMRSNVTHHVQEEETSLFPEVRQSIDQGTLDQMGQDAENLKQS